MANDMLVKLYDVQDDPALTERLSAEGIRIVRAFTGDKTRVLNFVRETFSQGWADECERCFTYVPVTCYIAVKDKQVIGFACYETTTLDFFGPTGVLESMRGLGVGRALLLRCLLSMREMGYGYAIIGWVTEARGFYEKCANAWAIPDSHPGVYAERIDYEPET